MSQLMEKFELKHKFAGENLFFTADTHFGHENILSYCNRPFKDLEEMDEAIIENWNAVVPEDGIVFHLGDFAFGTAGVWNDLLDKLNGKIHLILGNHDLKNFPNSCTGRFESVSHEMLIKVGQQSIILNHYPLMSYDGAFRDVWQLFGHIHSGPRHIMDNPKFGYLSPLQYDVGVDNNFFGPVSFEKLQKIMEERQK